MTKTKPPPTPKGESKTVTIQMQELQISLLLERIDELSREVQIRFFEGWRNGWQAYEEEHGRQTRGKEPTRKADRARRKIHKGDA